MAQTASDPRWLQIHNASREDRIRFKRAIVIYDLLVFAAIVKAALDGSPLLAGVYALMASQIPVLAILFGWERDRTMKVLAYAKTVLDLRKQSWAFLGDWVGLMPMTVFAVTAWQTLPQGRWFNDGWWAFGWAACSLTVGALFSLSFRRGEGDAYDVLRFFSYSKLLHNGVAFTLLAATMWYLMWPTLLAGAWWTWPSYPALATFSMLTWLAGAVGDGIRAGLPDDHPLKLAGRNLHPQADERGRRISPEIDGVPTWNEFKAAQPDQAIGWTDIFHTRKLIGFVLRLVRRRTRKS